MKVIVKLLGDFTFMGVLIVCINNVINSYYIHHENDKSNSTYLIKEWKNCYVILRNPVRCVVIVILRFLTLYQIWCTILEICKAIKKQILWDNKYLVNCCYKFIYSYLFIILQPHSMQYSYYVIIYVINLQ